MFQLQGQDLVINEFMSKNETSIQDKDGDYSDWLELYNKSENTINLLGFTLSDDIENLEKWIFPDISIEPNKFILIFASGKDLLTTEELHTNFQISADGENLILSDSEGKLMDQTKAEVLTSNEVYARFPDGSENWLKSKMPSPGSSNMILDQLKFSHNEGFYTSPLEVQISSILNETVYYSLDGSIPNENSKIYTIPIFLDYKYSSPNYFSEFQTSPDQSLILYKAWQSPKELIDKANILRCASYKNGERRSEIYTKTYFVDNTIFDKYKMPVISLVSEEENLFDYDRGIYVPGKYFDLNNPEWTGNYFQEGNEWERPVHIEYFNSDGSLAFSQDAGLRIHGFKTRQAAQKSLRLYAREEYGDKYFDYQLFPQKSFSQYKRFILQTSMGSWTENTIIMDVLAHEIGRDLNFDHQDYRPVIVYLNGEYWGIHTMRERIDERYIAYNHNQDKDSIDIINGNFKLVETGSNQHYIELAQFIESNDMTLDANFEYIENQIDMNSLIDYQITEMFLSNRDWPGNNQKLWRPQNEQGKWRWIFYDLDAAFGDYKRNMFDRSISHYEDMNWEDVPVSAFLINGLLKNHKFVDLFTKRYAELLNSQFETNNLLAKLITIKEMYMDNLPDHISRWNYPKSISNWENDVDKNLSTFIQERPCFARDHIVAYFNLEKFGFSCDESKNISNNLVIAPNPSPGSFFIHNFSEHSFLGNISICDLLGKIVHTEYYVFLEAGEKLFLDLKGLANGVYVLNLDSNKFCSSKKFMILGQ